MCVVCQVEGQDWKFRNGAKRREIFNLKLYNFYQAKVAQIGLCHCHSYELFLVGERRFLESYPKLVKEMIEHKNNYAVKETSAF